MTPPTTRVSSRRALAWAVLGLALVLGGCAETARLGAASDIHAFLIAIRDDDQAGFDAHVDRPLLKAQIRSQLMTLAAQRADRGGALAILGLALARPLADSVSDALIQPDVFRAVAESFGYSPDQPIPGVFVISTSLRRIDDTHVCVTRKKNGACLLDFRDEDGVWRLIGFEGDASELRLPRNL